MSAENRNLKIYKPEDIDGLRNIEELQKKAQQECERLKKEAQARCDELAIETFDKAMHKFNIIQMEIFEQSHAKINNFFDNAKKEINNILKSLFDKLKIDENYAQFLFNLLSNEIDILKIKSNRFTIYANQEILKELQKNIEQEYPEIENLHFDYRVKENLSSTQCLVESDYTIVQIDIRDFYEKALNIISS